MTSQYRRRRYQNFKTDQRKGMEIVFRETSLRNRKKKSENQQKENK